MMVLAVVLSADTSFFSKLKETTNLKKGEYLAVIYQTNGSCIKCYLAPMRKIEELVKANVILPPKKLALVRCDRDLELNIYKKTLEWKDYIYRDDGTAKKRLGVKDNSYLTIFDCNGNILYDFEI